MAGNAKRWNSKLLFGFLVLAGLVAGASVQPAPAAIAAGCEEDECDWGVWVDDCDPNPGVKTGCDAIDWNSCKTVVCDQAVAVNTN